MHAHAFYSWDVAQYIIGWPLHHKNESIYNELVDRKTLQPTVAAEYCRGKSDIQLTRSERRENDHPLGEAALSQLKRMNYVRAYLRMEVTMDSIGRKD